MIDYTTYKLPSTNYIDRPCKKRQIILGNTFNKDMKHFAGWLHRYNGHYTKTAAYTISRDGIIYQHFEPQLTSNYMGDFELDSQAIIILMENEGWLDVNDEENDFITWFGDIYKTSDNIVNKQWRRHYYWAPYTKAQMLSTVKLIKQLCEDFQIPPFVTSSNVKMADIEEFSGVLYKSNISGNYTDLSPAWNFVDFKNEIEIKTEHDAKETTNK